MQRQGKTLKELPPGDRRRMSDGKNAYRKMTPGQRGEFLEWIAAEEGPNRSLTSVEYEGFEAGLYRSTIDDKMVIQIDTPTDHAIATNGQPVCRVFVNDGRVWEGHADGSQVYAEAIDKTLADYALEDFTRNCGTQSRHAERRYLETQAKQARKRRED